MKGFSGVEHVLERVAEIGGVAFFNDSKATNVESARKSIEAFPGPVLVIMGGRYKGGDFGDLAGALAARGKAVLAIGEAQPRIADALRGTLPVVACASLAAAVAEAWATAGRGHRPARARARRSTCSRTTRGGRAFKAEVRRLQRRRATSGQKLSSDSTLFAVTVALLGLGLVMVWSSSSALAEETYGNAYHFLVKQVVWAALGLVVMAAAMRVDYRKLRQPATVYTAVAVTTALLILVLFMSPVNGHHRWIRLGSLSFQPAELAKLTAVLFLAYHLERKGERVNEFLLSIFPALLLLGWFAYLIFIQADLGSALVVLAIGGAMLLIGGVRLRYFAILAVLGVPVLYQAVMTAAYRRDRIEAFLNPYSDPRGSGYHIIQSLIAVGTGGVTGAGIMQGRQKLFYLPYPYSDFIFAVVGEELGLIGACAVVLAFVVILWRGVRAAGKAPDTFGTFLAAGLTLAIVLQAFINMSVVVGLLPTKGIPLPFLSAGGSSLLFTLLAVGLVLNVSQHAD